MGNHLTPSPLQDYALHDLPGNLSLDDEAMLDQSRFMKTLKCFNDDGKIVVKVYIQHRPEDREIIAEQKRILDGIFQTTSTFPNVLAFHSFYHTSKAGYMLRQYFHNNLYDRLSTRPFLTDIEKLWLTYQLMSALKRCHFHGIVHGDLKCENVLVTSWNWLFLSDFAPYKPTFIPEVRQRKQKTSLIEKLPSFEDNNGEFDYYFDSMGRRKCYLAPERFYQGNHIPTADDTQLPQMDIFSFGCVVAELWMEGKPLFTYSELLRFKKGTYDPMPKLADIKNMVLRDLIVSCINKDPTKRPTAEFTKWKQRLFPQFFEFLHAYIYDVMRLPPDDIVGRIYQDLEKLSEKFANESSEISSPKGEPSFVSPETPDLHTSESKDEPMDKKAPENPPSETQATQTQPTSPESSKSTDNDVTLGKPISAATSPIYEDSPVTLLASPSLSPIAFDENEKKPTNSHKFDIILEIPRPIQRDDPTQPSHPQFKGYVIIFNLLSSMLRSLKDMSASLKWIACVDWLNPHVDDQCRLQRLVPYLISILQEPNTLALVTSRAIKSLTRVISMVTKITVSDISLFPEYVLPMLTKFLSPKETTSELVRLTLAQCIPKIAEASKRFLELSQPQKDSRNKTETFYSSLQSLRLNFKSIVEKLLARESPRSIQMALLSNISTLANFFGQENTNEMLLPLLISCLNSRDTDLKICLFENVAGVSAISGGKSIESFIFSCILPEIYENQEPVTLAAVGCILRFTKMGFLSPMAMMTIVKEVSALLLHPNTWIRFETILLVTSVAEHLSEFDTHLVLAPLLKPFLVRQIYNFSDPKQLISSLATHIVRTSFEKGLQAGYETIPADVSHFNKALSTVTATATIQSLWGTLKEITHQYQPQKIFGPPLGKS